MPKTYIKAVKEYPNIYYQTGNKNIDESTIYNSLPDDLKETVDFIYNGKAVFKVNGDEFPKNGQDLNQRIYDYYKQNFDNVVNVDDIGEVIHDKRSIKDSIYHGVSSDKINAFAAVPYVLLNGKKAHTIENYNGKNETRYLFAAPIELNGKEYFCEVVVKKGQDKQAFYLHEVELTEKLSDVFSTAQHGTSDSSKSIIADLIKKFNTYYQDDYYADENGEGENDPAEIAALGVNDPVEIASDSLNHMSSQRRQGEIISGSVLPRKYGGDFVNTSSVFVISLSSLRGGVNARGMSYPLHSPRPKQS